MSIHKPNLVANLTRREALYGLSGGLGSLAFASMLQAEGAHSIGSHHPAKAKRCIFLMMEGGPSHIDTCDQRSRQADNSSAEADLPRARAKAR